MTISIEPTDFGQNILDSISPLLGAFGLLGSDGKLDINNWSLEKALGVFGTYERTEFILNLLSGYISTPTSVYREIASGLIVDKSNFSPDKIREEEWFPVSKGEGWSANIVVHHNKLGVLPSSTESAHTIDLGLGVHLDEMKFSLTSGDLLLSGHLAVPLIQITNKESGGTYVVTDEIPEINCERLIWDPTGEPLSRIALSASLKPESGRFGTTVSAEAISLKSAFGKPYTDPNDPSKTTSVILKLALLDFIAQANSPSSTLEVDLIEAVSGGMANVLEQVIPAIVELLPNDAQLFVENILPMLGLIDSDWSTLGGSPSAPAWPRIAVLPLVDELQNNPSQAWDRIRNWLLELANAEVANQWLTHLSNLLFDSVSQSGIVGGSCTQSDPARLKFLDLPGISADLLIALWEDPTGNKMLDTGLRFSANKTLGGAVDVEGGLTAWVASIPITGGGSVAFLPELLADFFIDGDGNNPLFDQTVGGGETGSPLDNLHVKIQQARLGVSVQRSGVIDPLVELIDVDIGSSPVNHYDQIDLTSGASVMDAIAGVLDTILDTVSDALAENDVLQWLGSLVGLVAPRDGTFRTDWEGAGSAGDLRIDIMRMIQNPKDEITDYYARLLETDIDPYGQGSMPAWVYVQEAFVLLINTALAGPMKIDKPSMPTGQATVLGDGSPSSPWRTMIGQEGDIPGFNFFTSIEPTDTTGVNRLTFGFGSLVSIIKVNQDLHLETNADLGLISFNLAEVAINDVPPESKLLPFIEASVKLHDAITFSGDSNDGTGRQIRIASLPGIMITSDGFSIKISWVNGGGFGLRATVHSPRIGSVFPNFTHLANQLPEISDLGRFSWFLGALHGPHGSVRPDLETFLDSSNLSQFDNPNPTLINYELEDENLASIEVQWDFFGLACPELGIDSKNGLFGFIDQQGLVNSLIDLLPNQKIIENEGVRMILGQILALKGGKFGFMASLLLRINPNLIYINLEDFAEKEIDFVPLESLNWHPDWLGGHPRSTRFYGLGLFSLPYDWPGVNWSNLCNNPFDALSDWFTEVLSSTSITGEPFIFPFSRWVSGMASNLIPDISQWDLGWHTKVDQVSNQVLVLEPDLPYDILGEGTYEKPYRVRISNYENSSVDILVWLGPDGPKNSNLDQHVYSSIGAKNLHLLEGEVAAIDPVSINYEFPTGWHYVCANLMVRLSNYSERLKSAIGNISELKLAELLMHIDQLIKLGDGISTIESQTAAFSQDIESSQKVSIGPHSDALKSEKVLEECMDSIENWLPNDWSPLTGQSSNGDYVLVLLSNGKNLDLNQFWSPLYGSIISENANISQINPVEIDYSTTTESTFSLDSNLLSVQSGIFALNFSKSKSEDHEDFLMQQQILSVIDYITNSGRKCMLIAHSWTGVVVQKLISIQEFTDSNINGLLTINSPLDGSVHTPSNNQITREALQILSSIFASIPHPSVAKSRLPHGVMDISVFQKILSDMRGEYDGF